jgi:hypothetical protein
VICTTLLDYCDPDQSNVLATAKELQCTLNPSGSMMMVPTATGAGGDGDSEGDILSDTNNEDLPVCNEKQPSGEKRVKSKIKKVVVLTLSSSRIINLFGIYQFLRYCLAVVKSLLHLHWHR